jgi:hypothetical protein
VEVKKVAKPDPDAKRLLLVAELDLSALPIVGADGLVDVPEEERRACERAIEVTANTASVLTLTRRRLATPWPPLALKVESAEERAYLAAAKGFRYGVRHSNRALSPIEQTIAPELMAGLTDRQEGLGAVAEFLAQAHPLGSYREAMRFFEMAFALPTHQIERKLSQFLCSSDRLGYTRAEVAGWLTFRDGAVHGDRRKAKTIIWESDVAQFFDRIEQAVLDVLYNKTDWHNSSSTRRLLWRPTSGTTGLTGLFASQGKGVEIGAQFFDGFGCYPHDLSASLTRPPEDWWCEFPNDLSDGPT